MPSVVVVMPSRGRPKRAGEAVEAIRDTAVLRTTTALVVVDADDPTLPLYREEFRRSDVALLATLPSRATGDLVRATNAASWIVLQREPDAIIGNLGDDHLCRTFGWDLLVTQALLEPGIAYGDDLIQGERLPTAPFISAEIVQALGWYALPTCRHMFIDDAWRALGEQLGCLRYLPEVVIEHVHPGVGKTAMDEGYARADASTEGDRLAFDRWRREQMSADVARVQAAIQVAA